MFIHEYSLLIAVALPGVVVLAINAILALSGERGTLLLPSLAAFPAVEMPSVDASPEAAPAEAVAEALPAVEELREAA